MAKYRIAGPDALRFLNRLVTRDLSKLKPDRVAYAIWCDDAGHLIDDGTVFRLGEAEYRLCAQERQLDWLLDSAIGFDVEIDDVTEDIAGLALQGPTSYAVLRALELMGVERLKPFDIGSSSPRALELTISRTGFTGDLGYELWLPPRAAESLWDRLMAAGSLTRPEATGFPRPQYRAHRGRVPAAQRRIHLCRAYLAGRARALAVRTRPRLAGRFRQGAFHRPTRAAGRAARRGGAPTGRIGHRGQQAGAQCAGLLDPYGPAGDRCGDVRDLVTDHASAILRWRCSTRPMAASDVPVWVEIYLNSELTWERRMCQARIVERPFFAPDRRRATPPAEH